MTALATGAELTATKNEPSTTREKWRRRGPLLPALVFAVIITQIPFLVTIAISFLNWNILQPGAKNFLGLGQYQSFAGLDNDVGAAGKDPGSRTAFFQQADRFVDRACACVLYVLQISPPLP